MGRFTRRVAGEVHIFAIPIESNIVFRAAVPYPGPVLDNSFSAAAAATRAAGGARIHAQMAYRVVVAPGITAFASSTRCRGLIDHQANTAQLFRIDEHDGTFRAMELRQLGDSQYFRALGTTAWRHDPMGAYAVSPLDDPDVLATVATEEMIDAAGTALVVTEAIVSTDNVRKTFIDSGSVIAIDGVELSFTDTGLLRYAVASTDDTLRNFSAAYTGHISVFGDVSEFNLDFEVGFSQLGIGVSVTEPPVEDTELGSFEDVESVPRLEGYVAAALADVPAGRIEGTFSH